MQRPDPFPRERFREMLDAFARYGGSVAAVDVVSEIVIDCPLSRVAEFAGDPGNAPIWYANISSVSWITDPPIGVGSRIAFWATFLGRELSYTYEIVELEPYRRLLMRTAEGPFPMETTYTWERVGVDATRMTVRNRGHPSGFASVGAPMLAIAMRRANQKDLANLKRLLEEGRAGDAALV